MKSPRTPFTLFIMALILLVALAACNGCRPGPEPPPTSTPTIPAPPTAKPTKTATATATAPKPTAKPTKTATPTAQPTITATPTTPTPPPTSTPMVAVGPPQVGWASYYAEGVFQHVMDAHREFAKYPPDLKPEQAAAIADCRFKRDGGRIYVRPVDIKTGEPLAEGRVLYVVDCAGDRLSADWMEDNNIIVEIDESLWQEWARFHDRYKGLRVEVIRLE